MNFSTSITSDNELLFRYVSDEAPQVYENGVASNCRVFLGIAQCQNINKNVKYGEGLRRFGGCFVSISLDKDPISLTGPTEKSLLSLA
jgi:hypothetical protein